MTNISPPLPSGNRKSPFDRRVIIAFCAGMVVGSIAIAMCFGVVAALTFGDRSDRARSLQSSTKSAPAAKQVDVPTGNNALTTARNFMVGTWTYVGNEMTHPDPEGGVMYKWEKLVIRADGTLDEFQVAPSSDGWGEPKRRSYEVFTGKYKDSGERFYAIGARDAEGTAAGLVAFTAIIQPTGELRYRVDVPGMQIGDKLIPAFHYDVMLTRGDQNPFSK